MKKARKNQRVNGYKKNELANQFLMGMAAFVVMLGGMLVVLLGMSVQTREVLGGKIQKKDAIDEVEKKLNSVGDMSLDADVMKLEEDISGL